MMCRLFLLLLTGLSAVYTYAADGEMPIIGYWGVPESQTTEANFRDFKACGFSVSLFPYSSLGKLVQACRTAEKAGVQVLGRCPELTSDPARAAAALKYEMGFFGYFLQDEPSAPDIRKSQQQIARLKTADDTHPFYINLLPYQKADPNWVSSTTKADTYPNYLRVASSTSCQQISFDHYPITTKGIRDTWYHNLEMVRQESLSSGKPFWGFVLSVPHVDYPSPTLGSLRLQAYSNLAYGAQAIQYFTYWTPDKNADYDFHDAPISPQGRKTATYPLVQKMNGELKTVATLFYGAKVVSVGHLGEIPRGTAKQKTMPVNIRSLKVKGRKGAIVSLIDKASHRYLAIVNKDYKSSLTVQIKARNAIPLHLSKQLEEEPMETSYTVSGGDILLFKLN